MQNRENAQRQVPATREPGTCNSEKLNAATHVATVTCPGKFQKEVSQKFENVPEDSEEYSRTKKKLIFGKNVRNSEKKVLELSFSGKVIQTPN